MRISRRTYEDVLVLKPEVSRIDAHLAVEFKTALQEAVKRGHIRLIVNLSEVDFIDSSGLGALVSVIKSIGKNGRFAVCEMRTGVRSILELTRLDRVLDLFNSESEALKSMLSEP